MFIVNKYFHWYHSIIASARTIERSGYTESHHILPKSLGGSNAKDNLVELTAREHFICHQLLARFTEGPARSKMLKAIWRTSHRNGKMQRVLSSRQYEIARKACAEAASLYRHSDESKLKISTKLTGKPKSEEHRRNTGLSSKGRTWTAAQSANPNLNKGAANPNSKSWEVTLPDGSKIETNCLKIWCAENDINYTGFGLAAKESRPYRKGYFLRRL